MFFTPIMRRALLRLIVLAGLMNPCLETFAQWTIQTNLLRPGWNAVYLEVQPDPRDCGTVFAGLPIETVWRYNRRFDSVQFINDPNDLISQPQAWLTWIPAAHPLASKKSLFIVEGGEAYLIKTTNTTTVQWIVRGRPSLKKTRWLSDALNLVGFDLPDTSTRSFQTFFAGAPGLTNLFVYRLNTSGIWAQIPATTAMQRGEAFWLRSQGLPTFQGPIEAQTDTRVGLDYGRLLTEQNLRIYNASPSNRTVNVRQLPSQTPSASEPALAGTVPLSYLVANVGAGQIGWTNFPSQLQSNIPPRGTWTIPLEVRRADMAAFTPPPTASNALYQALLEVSETSGLSRQLVPVVSEGFVNFTRSAPAGFSAFGGPPAPPPTPLPHPRAGLWVGSAVINQVNQPATANPNALLGTPAEFQFRLIVHVDNGGQARLLQKVLLLWKDGTFRTNQAGFREVDIPGRHVLVTDDQLIPSFVGSTLRDGEEVGRRISSAAFGFRSPVLFAGAGDFGSNTVTAGVSIDYNDPVNPYKHKFHPDHDNLDPDGNLLGQGVESFTVGRQIALAFTADDPDHLTFSGWGDTQLGGVYSETITGLHQNTLRVQGSFRLNRAYSVGVLNDGL